MSTRRAASAAAVRISWQAGLIALAGVLAYWNSLSGPFIFDDQLSIVANRQIREWWRLGSVLFPERELPVAGRPLVNLSFALNYAIGGLDVRGYHVWNLAIHLLCALLAFAIVRRTLDRSGFPASLQPRSVSLAFAVALVWTLHPLNSEVVDYLTERTESMMALCYLLTVYAAIRAVGSPRAVAWQAIAIVSCTLGMACKESMVTAPLMVVLYDGVFAFGSLRQALRARWRFHAGLAMTWLALAAVMWSGPRVHSAGFSSGVHPWMYLLNQTVMITHYLRLAVWPRSLVLNYGLPLPLTLGDVMPYALLIVLLLALTVAALVWRPRLGFLGAWFFVTLAPTSSVVPIATEVGAERRMYLPLLAVVALALVGGSSLLDLVRRRWPEAFAIIPVRMASFSAALVLIVVSVALAAGTVARNREYASGLSLARTVLERHPTSIAHQMLGKELMIAGDHEEAMMHLREAAREVPRARFDLGVELYNQRKLDEAIEQFQAFVREEPLLLDVISARVLMGRAFAMQRQWPRAIEQFRLVLGMTPSNIEARGLLADVLSAQQSYEEASVHYREYLKSRPNDAGALGRLGLALVATGKGDEATEAFGRAVEVDPRNADMRHNLATVLLDRGDVEGAALHARQAAALRPDDPAIHELLGRVFALQGKLDEAKIQFERALQIDPAHAEAREDLRRLLRLRGSSPNPVR